LGDTDIKENQMELQELVERIQRWKARQGGGDAVGGGYGAPQAAYRVEPADEGMGAQAVEAPEMNVEPEAIEAEEPTSEMSLDQIEEVD
jgi:hypothetical protein